MSPLGEGGKGSGADRVLRFAPMMVAVLGEGEKRARPWIAMVEQSREIIYVWAAALARTRVYAVRARSCIAGQVELFWFWPC